MLLLTLKKNCFKHLFITKRVFHISTVWTYSCVLMKTITLMKSIYITDESKCYQILVFLLEFECLKFSLEVYHHPFEHFSNNCHYWNSSKEFWSCTFGVSDETSSCSHYTGECEESIKSNVLNHWKAKAIKMLTEIKLLKCGKL